ncbi:MAG: hypothetical protein AAF125_14395, partial [Chloroflexota bacterium]
MFRFIQRFLQPPQQNPFEPSAETQYQIKRIAEIERFLSSDHPNMMTTIGAIIANIDEPVSVRMELIGILVTRAYPLPKSAIDLLKEQIYDDDTIEWAFELIPIEHVTSEMLDRVSWLF